MIGCVAPHNFYALTTTTATLCFLNHLYSIYEHLSSTIMSGLPPLSAEPGTPAAEWAAKTTTALEPNPGTPPTRTMNPTTRQLFEEKNLRPGTVASDPLANPPTSTAQRTPSQEVPGAFPSDAVEPEARGGQEIMQNATDTANRVAQTVQETAAVYLPKAAETIGQYLPKGVVDTMSTYMRTCFWCCLDSSPCPDVIFQLAYPTLKAQSSPLSTTTSMQSPCPQPN